MTKNLTTLLLTLLIIAGCSEYSNETECKLKEMQKCDGSRSCELAASDYCRDEYRVVEKPKKKTPEEIKKEEEKLLAYQKKQEEIAKQLEIEKKQLEIEKKQQEKEREERRKLREKADDERERLLEQKEAALRNCEEENIHSIFCIGGPDRYGSIDNVLKCDDERNYFLLKDDRFVVLKKNLTFEDFGTLKQDINVISFYKPMRGIRYLRLDRETLILYAEFGEIIPCKLIDVTQAEKEIRDRLEEKRQAIQIQLGKNKI